MSREYLCAIEDFGQQSAEFLGIFDPDLKRLHSLRPFGACGIKQAQPIGGLIYTISHLRNRAKDGTPIALIDAISGRELARERSFILPDQIVNLPQNGMIALIGSLTEVEFRDAQTLALIWTCRPRVIIEPSGILKPIPNDLTVSQAHKNATKPLQHLAEGPDGLVRMPMFAPQMTGVFEINLATRAFRLVSFDPDPADKGFYGGFRSISPDGRWGIRECVDLRVEPFEQLKSEYGKWFLVTRFFELWDLPGQFKQANIVTAHQPVLVYDHSREEALSYYHWLLSGGSARGRIRFVERASKGPQHSHEANLHEPRRHVIGDRQRFFWEPDSKGVWLVQRYSMMRAELDGTTGPLIFPDHGLGDAQRAALQGRQSDIDLGEREAYPHGQGCGLIRSVTKPRPNLVRFDFYSTILDLPLPYEQIDAHGPYRSRPKLTARDVEAQLQALIRVNSWTQNAVGDALADLNARIKSGLESLVSGNGLTFVFKLRGAFLDEWTFFEKLHEKKLAQAPVLREILTTWCDAHSDKQWYFTSDAVRAAGPMSGALACLAQIDDRCHDVLRRYCLLRDGEHESYARDTVLLGFIERKTLADIDTLRLAVFFVMLRDKDGLFSVEDGEIVYPWGELGIPLAARTLMKPDDFAQLVMDEAAQLSQSGNGTDTIIGGLIRKLDLSEPWDARVHSLLSG